MNASVMVDPTPTTVGTVHQNMRVSKEAVNFLFKSIVRGFECSHKENKHVYLIEIMTSNIPKVLDQLVNSSVIRADQKEEVVALYLEMQKAMQSSDAYKLMEPLKNSIPESLRQMTPDITYEDSMLLSMAVQTSNIKKAGKFLWPTY